MTVELIPFSGALGECLLVAKPKKTEWKHLRLPAPLSQLEFERWLEGLTKRGVGLSYYEPHFEVSYPVYEEWPYRDRFAWLDLERIRTNFVDLMVRFGLSVRGFSVDLPINKLPLVFCDIETTGVGEQDRIIEVAICRVEPNEEPQWFSTLIHPEIHIPNSAIHGITNLDVLHSPVFSALLEPIQAFCEGAVFISHTNSRFDERLLAAEFSREGIVWAPSASLQTVPLARKLFPEFPSHKLKYLAEVLDLPVEKSHRAKSDVKTLIALWEKLQLKANTRPNAPTTLAHWMRL